MFSLTLREQFLVAGILCALVTGVAVKHWRDARREARRTAAVAATDAPAGTRHAKSP